jgi:predicted nucleic acid-binding protein
MGITPMAITDRIRTMATIPGLHITGTVGIVIIATIAIIVTTTGTNDAEYRIH